MSARAESGFLPVLRELGARLSAPLPSRTRFLRELAYDLEELSDRFHDEGLPAAEARQRAYEALVPGEPALRALDRMHAPWYVRSTSRVPTGTLRILERSALAAVTAFVVVAGGSLLFSSGILDDASPFLWPVLALGAFLFASTCAKTFQLWIKRDHTRLWGGMTTILVLVWTLPMAGVGGAFADTFRLATTLERDPSAAEALVFQWLIRDTTLLATALLLCLAGALAWFLLRQWIVLVEQAHREVLGIDDKQPTGRS